MIRILFLQGHSLSIYSKGANLNRRDHLSSKSTRDAILLFERFITFWEWKV
jgi:hypothetical protein